MKSDPSHLSVNACSEDNASGSLEAIIGQVADEFTERLYHHEQPQIEEYAQRYPHLAPVLRQVLSALQVMGCTATDPLMNDEALGAAPALRGCLGDFRILREIGRGGMGIVYEAEQLSLGRRVALKVLPFAATLHGKQLQRFKHEAQAAGQLHHTNIVPVHAVGCERGVHYYAMQLIEGQTLAAVIHELRGQAMLQAEDDGPSVLSSEVATRLLSGQLLREKAGQANDVPTPPTARRVPSAPAAETVARAGLSTECSIVSQTYFRSVTQLGVQAAEALEHAHDEGVVHRDIKPANLLVDVKGKLWITDFGLAHCRAGAELTMTGDVVGTLRYMSPEQALGKRLLVDYRTDIYSLGVTLYELLTLEPAFPGSEREELLRKISCDEPLPPRRLSRAIPADLETIVLKAMAKRPEERYVTARELAEDLRRFLEHKPIQARRPTLLERAAKWSRRHRGMVMSAVVVLMLSAVGFAASTVLIAREKANTEMAYQRVTEEQSRTKAAYEAEVRNFRQARRMLDFFSQVSAEELADKPDAQEVRRKLLEAALDYYQNFIKQCPDDGSTREELAQSHLRVANLLHEMGARAGALLALEEARRILQKKPNPELEQYSSTLRLNWLRNGGPLLLLEQRSVQEELKFSPEQLRQVGRLAFRRRTAFWDNPNLSLERWRTKFEELAAQEEAVLKSLQPQQAKRLKQIAWQEGGASAFSDGELQEALQLNGEQLRRIEAIQAEARRSMLFIPGPRGPRSEDWRKAADSWRNARDKVLAVLTADQNEIWEELIGEPFRGQIRLLFPSSFGLRPSPWMPKKP